MHNLLETREYLDLFRQYPPVGFDAGTSPSGWPFFRTVFDLLTTLDAPVARRIKRFPLLPRLMRLKTCFVGTTITEYTPVPGGLTSGDFIEQVLNGYSGQSLTIIKDIPSRSPLLTGEENDYADALVDDAEKHGFIAVEGQALAYVPIDFSNMDEYLARFSHSRRKDLRRKMKKRTQLDIKVVGLGDPMFHDERLLEDYYAMYREVFDQSEIHFDLLSSEYFRALLGGNHGEGIVVLYYSGSELAGYNICLINNGMLIDKYIGFRYPLAREVNLYFISWMYNLQFALDHGLGMYVAGWTDPAVKAALGARFTFTRHLVWVKNSLLRVVLSRMKRFFESDKKTMEKL